MPRYPLPAHVESKRRPQLPLSSSVLVSMWLRLESSRVTPYTPLSFTSLREMKQPLLPPNWIPWSAENAIALSAMTTLSQISMPPLGVGSGHRISRDAGVVRKADIDPRAVDAIPVDHAAGCVGDATP